MMTELSLNVLDITENSVKAGASLISIDVDIQEAKDLLTIKIKDNGCGMTPEEIEQVTDPFFTSRTTRKVGLGVPFFKYSAECTGGSFYIKSEKGTGTEVFAEYVLSSIDRMPLGDISSSIHQLVTQHCDIDFVYTYRFNGNSCTLDTREFREILGEVPFNEPEVSAYIMDYLVSGKSETDNDAFY